MAIQMRHGDYDDFDPQKMVTAEWAVVTSGTPNVSDGKAVYMAFEPGKVKRMATYEDMEENIENAADEIIGGIAEAAENASAAAADANAAAAEANKAAEAIEEAVSGVINDSTKSSVTTYSSDKISEDYLAVSMRGQRGGIASLNEYGKVPMFELPAGQWGGIATLDSYGKLSSEQIPGSCFQLKNELVEEDLGGINVINLGSITETGIYWGTAVNVGPSFAPPLAGSFIAICIMTGGLCVLRLIYGAKQYTYTKASPSVAYWTSTNQGAADY